MALEPDDLERVYDGDLFLNRLKECQNGSIGKIVSAVTKAQRNVFGKGT